MRRVWAALLLGALLASTLLGIIAYVTLTPHPTPASTDSYGMAARSIEYQTNVILDDLPQPSVAELKSLNITELGVSIWPDFASHPEWWSLLTAWNSQMHQRGFTTRATIHYANDTTIFVPMIVRAGFDVLGFDELLSDGELNSTSLMAAIAFARSLNAHIGISLNEYSLTALNTIHELVEKYRTPGVRMASSDFNNLTQAENLAAANLTALPPHRHGAWIIFINDTQNSWDSYRRLNTWIRILTGTNLDLLLWEVDSAGTWQQNWPLVTNIIQSSEN